jgi:Sec7-like guanine-nucleotide exchange factor
MIIDNTTDSVAQFLYTGEGLNKTAIGEYLGEKYVEKPYVQHYIRSTTASNFVSRNEFSIEVLHKFVQLHEFKNKLLVIKK